MKNYYDCSGCSVCSLVCPTWTQNQDVMLTPWGRAKAIQGGATAIDLKESLESCVNCGACEVVCPETINLHREESLLKKAAGLLADIKDVVLKNSENNFYASEDLKQYKLSSHFENTLQKHASKGDIITDEFQIQQKLLESNKIKKVFSVGEWLIHKKILHPKIKKGDLYWMDAKLFHSKYEKLVKEYDIFQKETGCLLNWNLQRTAMPLGEDNSYFERKKQFEWVIFNKNIQRIVVENTRDWQWLKENSHIPVVHVLELLEGNAA